MLEHSSFPSFSRRYCRSLYSLATWALVLSTGHGASSAPLPPPARATMGAGAVTPPVTHTVVSARKPIVVAKEYRLAPGDVLAVVVLKHPEMSAGSVAVSSTGRIQLPVAGDISVLNKTLPQARAEIIKRLSTRLRRPEVTVTLVQARINQAFVQGVVVQPGVIPLATGWRVSEVLTTAQGLLIRPDLVKTTLTRLNQKPRELNIEAILNNNNHPDNVLMRNGDTLRFADRSIRVSISGQAKVPGMIAIAPGDTLVDAISQVGGATEKAALSKVVVRHADGTSTPVNLYKSIVLGQKEHDLVLRAGDLISIPEATERISVIGALSRGGSFPVPDGKTIRYSEAIAMAGGTIPGAALLRATVRHLDGTSEAVNLYRILTLGKAEGDLLMRDGDVLTIPQLRGVTVIGSINKPGPYYIEEGQEPRIADVLAMAGGLSLPVDSVRISIARPTDATNLSTQTTASAVPLKIDPVGLINLTDLTQNEPVRDGDLISVAAIPTPTVYINGEVKSPGQYVVKEGEGIAELLTRAGGTTPEASLTEISISQRGGNSQVVDVMALMRTGQGKTNVPLQEGDFIVVPRNPFQVTVANAVSQPGQIAIPEKGTLTIGDAINKAGGLRNAKTGTVYVFRQTPTGVKSTQVVIDRVVKGELGLNKTLQPGDILYVPDVKESKNFFQKVAGAIASVGPLGALLGF